MTIVEAVRARHRRRGHPSGRARRRCARSCWRPARHRGIHSGPCRLKGNALVVGGLRRGSEGWDGGGRHLRGRSRAVLATPGHRSGRSGPPESPGSCPTRQVRPHRCRGGGSGHLGGKVGATQINGRRCGGHSRVLVIAKRSARQARSKALTQMRHLSFTAPDELRCRLKGLTDSRLGHRGSIASAGAFRRPGHCRDEGFDLEPGPPSPVP